MDDAQELVVLVDAQGNEIGTYPKATVHTANTPLHKAFSLFVFNRKHELLVTQRAKAKKTFGGVWTNTVCGHPGPGESDTDAMHRRLRDELGLDSGEIYFVSPYRYQYTDKNGIMENEICPVYVAYTDHDPQANPAEIDAWKWMDWDTFLSEIKNNPEPYSPWCKEEALLVSTWLLQHPNRE
jgi:isopentenyl-diphosphate delta-isomerase